MMQRMVRHREGRPHTVDGPDEASVWTVPAWRRAFPAAVVSRLGDVVFDLTMVLWISTDLAVGRPWAPAAVSGVLIAAAVPTLVVGPLAGVVVDRVDRHTVMILSNLVQAVTIGSLLIVPALGGRLGMTAALLWVYTVVVVSNGAGQFFNQARTTMIAGTVSPEQRPSAFSALQASAATCRIVGPPLAAPLLFSVGVSWAIGINAVSFLASTLLLSGIRWSSRPEPEASSESFVRSLRDGAVFVVQDRVLRAIVLAVTVVTLGSGAINVLEVFFIRDVLRVDADLLGVMMMAEAIGVILGSLLAPAVGRRLSGPAVFIWGLAVAGVLLMVYSRITDFGPALLIFFVAALPIAMVNAFIGPLFIQSVPSAMLGRASAAVNVLPTIASLIAMGAAGWLVSTVMRGLDVRILGTTFGPVDTVFFLAGALFLGTALAVWRPLLHASATATAAGHESRRM